MTGPTHIRQLDGSVRGPLLDDIRPYRDQIRHSLKNMNGASSWAYGLWRAPEGADLLEDIPFSEEYVQCAGSAEAMTVEVRTLDPDGTAHQYTVGMPGGDDSAAPTEVIRWDDDRRSATVHRHEVFTADEAADVLYAYFLTDRVPESYVLRELDLTWPPPAEQGGAEVSERMTVEIERVDAHQGDLYGRSKTVEEPSRLMLSDLLATVLEPFLDQAPRAMWVCRGKSRGKWREFAEVVTYGPPERLGTRLLLEDESLRSFVGATETFQVACRPRELVSTDGRSGPARGMAVRPLIFSDDNDNEQEWPPGRPKSTLDAFFEFVGHYSGDDNWSFTIEDDENSEALALMFAPGIICRATADPTARGEYRLVTDDGDYRTHANNFIRGGFAALDLHGPWWPDVASLMHALEHEGRAGEVQAGTEHRVDLSEAITLYLKNYPGTNEEEFRSRFETDVARDAVRAVLDETMRMPIDWTGKSLADIGDEVRTVMHERHPQLSDAAINALANYFTYLVK